MAPCVLELEEKEFRKLLEKSKYNDLFESQITDNMSVFNYVSEKIISTLIYVSMIITMFY